MNTDHQDKNSQPEEGLSWEKRLENMRQTRQFNTANTYAPLIQESKGKDDFPQAPKPPKLDDTERGLVLEAYLKKWQEEHNAEAEEPEEGAETDPMVILQENWLNAQSSLQMSVSEKHIESQRTVWLNPKQKQVVFELPEAEAGADEQGEDAAEAADKPSDTTEETDAAKEPEVLIPVNINILNPKAVNRRDVFCISERELTERLIQRLRPHLTDTVNGIIRTAVQKQMALFTHQLQQMLHEQAGSIVEEVLEHDMQKILNDLKYEMKYKR